VTASIERFLSAPNLYRDQPHDFFGWLHLLWLPVFERHARGERLEPAPESTTFIVVANMLADAVQAWLDPKVR
jgi:hypothetical protein